MKALSMSSGFSLDRFKHITYRFLVLNKKSYSLAFGGVLIGLYSFWLFQVSFAEFAVQASTKLIFAAGIMLYQIGGLFLTSVIFSELQSSGSASQMLTLPAKTSEKLLSAWTVSYLMFTLASFLLLALILSLTSISAGILLGDSAAGTVDWTVYDFVNLSLTYLVFNSIFLLGSVYFRSKNFLKTVLSIMLFLFSTAVIMIAIINLSGLGSFNLSLSSFLFFSSGNQLLILLSQVLTYVPLAAFFIILSYYKLKNRQVVA